MAKAHKSHFWLCRSSWVCFAGLDTLVVWSCYCPLHAPGMLPLQGLCHLYSRVTYEKACCQVPFVIKKQRDEGLASPGGKQATKGRQLGYLHRSAVAWSTWWLLSESFPAKNQRFIPIMDRSVGLSLLSLFSFKPLSPSISAWQSLSSKVCFSAALTPTLGISTASHTA